MTEQQLRDRIAEKEAELQRLREELEKLLPWKPEHSEPFYVPDPMDPEWYTECHWDDDEPDRLLYERGVVKRTPEEAIAVAKGWVGQ